MKTTLLCIILCCILNCDGAMTNEQIVKEIKFCTDNGTRAAAYTNISGSVYKVVCRPKD